MPDEIEFDAREAHEKIEEVRREHAALTIEPQHERWLRLISLSTAVLAVVAAVASLQSSALVNESLMEQIKAAQLQAQASDQWNYFQAKGIKANIAVQTADLLSANPSQASLAGKHQQAGERYRQEQTELETRARELERERDEKERLSQSLMHRHHPFAYCVTFTQIAIAMSAIGALTRRRPVWYTSMIVGLAGIVFLIQGFAGG
jgi:hypothetical protein